MTAIVKLTFSDNSTLAEWQSVSLKDSFADPIGEFRLSSAPITDGGVLAYYRDRLKKGELVSVSVNNVPQFVGLVQTVDTMISDGGVVFEVSGGTPLLTPYEGAAVEDPNNYAAELSFRSENADVPVRDLILRVMRPYGFTVLEGDDGAHVDLTSGKKRQKKKKKLTLDALTQREAVAHPGETAYGLCARVVTRLGVCLKMRWDGIMFLTRPDYDQEISYTLGQTSDENFTGDRFFGAIQIHDTNEGQFSEVCVRGQAPESADATSASRPIGVVKSTAINETRPPYKSEIAIYKPKVIKDKQARDLGRSESTAKLSLGLAAQNAYTIVGTVDGWISRTDRIWTVNTLARVIVQKMSVDEVMFVLSRTLIQDADGGQRTQLVLVPKGYVVLGDVPGGD